MYLLELMRKNRWLMAVTEHEGRLQFEENEGYYLHAAAGH